MTEGPITVVVPCHDRAALLARCLEALRAEVRRDDRIVVVDSASAGAAVRSVALRHDAQYLRCERPGASLARNSGWRGAPQDVVAFVDDDVLVAPGWRRALGDALSSSEVAFVVGALDAEAAQDAVPRATVVRDASRLLVRPADAGVVSAGNLAVRRAVLAQVGGFDERLGPGTPLRAGEDAELIDRLLERRYRGAVATQMAATHVVWRTAGQWQRLQWDYGVGAGARVAAALRRHPRESLPRVREVLRIGGVRTAARRMSGTATPSTTGWSGPIRWRLGALAGLAVGLVRLRPERARG